MSAVALIIVGTIALAVVLATFLPGAGFIGAITVVVIGLTAIVWLLSASTSKQAPSDVARNTEDQAPRTRRPGRSQRALAAASSASSRSRLWPLLQSSSLPGAS